MRIYLLSNYGGVPDEGFKTVAFNLHRELARSHEVAHALVATWK